MFQWLRNSEGSFIKVSVIQESNSKLNISFNQMEHLEVEQHGQYPVERNPNAYRSMRDYRNPPRMSVPSCMVPPTIAPYGNAYNPSWRNHLNLSWGLKPIQYAPPAHPLYASSSQPQLPQSTSPIEQAILNLTKLVDDFVGEQKTFNAQLSQRIHILESSLNHKLEVLQSDLDQKIDILQYSISRLTNQHVHQEEESPEEECLSDTMVEEQCQQQLLFESSYIDVAVYPWEKKEVISPMLTEEGSGKEAREEQKKLILQPIPIKLNPSTTAQATKSPLPAALSHDPVHILPSPAAHLTPETPTAKVIPSTLPSLQNLKKLAAIVQTCATTSKTLAAAHTAWYNGWFGCWFGCRAPGPQHFYKLHQFQQPPKA